MTRSVLPVVIIVASLGIISLPSAVAASQSDHANEGASLENVLVRRESAHGHRSDHAARWTRVPILRGETRRDALERLDLTDGIAEVAPEYSYHETAAPNDPAFVYQWHLPIIGVEQAWEHGNGSGVTVAVIDSGVATGGSDLTCQPFVQSYNSFSGSTDLAAVSDDTGHGTHIIGTIAQCTDNGIGAAGVAPGASIMPVKALDGGTGTSLEVANGILWAVDHGANVVNLSLGRSCSSTWPTCADKAVDSAIEYAHSAGVLVVAATGNEGASWVSSPANHPSALAVGATTSVDSIATYSNFGEAMGLVAPGGNSGDLDGNGRSDDIFQESFDASGWGILPRRGTSSASPHVSGVAALVLSVDPGLSVDQVETILTSTAVDLGASGWDPIYGAGRVDAAAAALASSAPITAVDTYVLGGLSAVGKTVIAEIEQVTGVQPTRVSGSDRYATASEISRQFHPSGSDTVYVVTGEKFPDALGIGAVAAMDDAPVLLVTRTTVPQCTADELRRLAPSLIVVVGGIEVIDDSVTDRLNDLTTGAVTRIAGSDRYATAAAVSRSVFSPGVDHAFVVTGETYPDGMSASPVASDLGAPVLLTEARELTATTHAELIRLSPGIVVIAGGTNAVSNSVETSIRDLGFDVTRIAGPDRYGTAAALSSTFFDHTTRPVFLATGEAFPDALSGAAAAGTLGGPLLLTRTTSLPRTTRSELERFFP